MGRVGAAGHFLQQPYRCPRLLVPWPASPARGIESAARRPRPASAAPSPFLNGLPPLLGELRRADVGGVGGLGSFTP